MLLAIVHVHVLLAEVCLEVAKPSNLHVHVHVWQWMYST